MELLSRPRDTQADAWQRVLEIQRRTSGFEKVRQALDISRAVRALSLGEGSVSVTTLEELFRFLVSGLEAAEVEFMIVGSFASTYHGLPRATQDLDIVCEIGPAQLQRLFQVFDDDSFYLNQQAASQAVRDRGMFNIVHPATGWKIDLIVRKARPFSLQEFERRQTAEMFGKRVYVASAEDTILSKLEWAKASFSERQLRDVAEILDTQGEAIDFEYLKAGLRELGLEEQFERARGPW